MRASLSLGVVLVAAGCPRASNQVPPVDASALAPPIDAATTIDAAIKAASTDVDAAVAVVDTCDAGDERCRPANCAEARAKASPALRDLACNDNAMLRPLGLSMSGRFFGHCNSRCEPCGASCKFVDLVTGQKQSMATADEHRDKPDYRPTAAEKRAASFLETEYPTGGSVPLRFSGPFPYDDIVFAETSTVDKDKTGKTTLRFGARIGGDEPVYPFSMSVGPHTLWNHVPEIAPEIKGAARKAAQIEAQREMRESFEMDPATVGAADVSRDGKMFGVVAFAHGSGWFEASDMIVMPTAHFAARLYDEAGRAALAVGKVGRAVALFGKARAAHPDEPRYASDEAAARAKLGD